MSRNQPPLTVCRTEYCVRTVRGHNRRCKSCLTSICKYRNSMRKDIQRITAMSLLRLERMRIAMGPFEKGGYKK